MYGIDFLTKVECNEWLLEYENDGRDNLCVGVDAFRLPTCSIHCVGNVGILEAS